MSTNQNSFIEAFIFNISQQKRFSKYTIRNYQKAICDWSDWLSTLENIDCISVSKKEARGYVVELSQKYSINTLHNRISAIRSFYKFLIQTNSIDFDPFSSIKLPKLKKDLPHFLTESNMPILLETPKSSENTDKYSAFLDALCLELLYGGGLRISELCNLRWLDIDFSTNIARVLGKGQKLRFCPLGDFAGQLLREWKSYAIQSDFILILKTGTQIYPRYIQRMIKKYLLEAGLPTNITPHKLRHSYATHLVNNGIDLRCLQEMLGHSSLSTTQIYTHLSTKKLIQEHRDHHPRR